MTLTEARRLYIAAVDDPLAAGNGPDWWEEVWKEMEAVVAARSDRAAGDVIRWWTDWDRDMSATKQARLIREEWTRMKK